MKRAALALILAIVACAAPSRRAPVAPGAAADNPRLEADARAAVKELGATYERAQAEDFFALVDQSSFPDFVVFQDRIRQYLFENHAVNLNMIVDKVLRDGDEASVSLHWNKGFVSANGRQQNENGACELILKARSSGGAALTAVQGDSPF